MQVDLWPGRRMHGTALAHHPPPAPLLGQIPHCPMELSHVDRARVVNPLADLVHGHAVGLLGKLFADQDMLTPSGSYLHLTNLTHLSCRSRGMNKNIEIST